jgi:alanyl-tRNA synthetase
MVDQLKDRLKSAVVLLATTSADGKISLVAGVTADLSSKIKAGDLVGFVAGQLGGKGGGRPDMAMGGGTDVQALPASLTSVKAWVESK